MRSPNREQPSAGQAHSVWRWSFILLQSPSGSASLDWSLRRRHEGYEIIDGHILSPERVSPLADQNPLGTVARRIGRTQTRKQSGRLTARCKPERLPHPV